MESPPRLHRVLGLAFGVAVTVGVTIGAGILKRPGAVAGALGEPWLILLLWTLGGVYALLAALTVAELATAIPLAGGFFVWAQRAFGPEAGFAIGWCDFLANCASVAFMAITLAEIAAPQWSTALALALILLFAAIQWRGIRSGDRAQKLTSALLALAYLALVASAFLLGDRAQAVTITSRQFAMGLFGALIFAFQSIVVTYDGWYHGAYFAEEIVDPARTLPRSMTAGVITVTAVYLLVNLALLHALPLDKLAASDLPAADLANLLFGANGKLWITGLSFFALLPALNACLLGGSRVLVGLSRERLFWTKAASVNAGGTPDVALAATVIVSATLVLSGTFERLLALAGFFFVFEHCSAFAALFVLRAREPHLPRAYRVPSYPWTPAAVLLTGSGFLVGALVTDTRNSLIAAGFLALCAPLYWLLRRK